MYSSKHFMIGFLLMAISIAVSAASSSERNQLVAHGGNRSKLFGSRFPHSRKTSWHFQCGDYPQICKGQWSPGSDCCNGRCVNLHTNKFHCGECGTRCNFLEICCSGECVNPLFDIYHCGYCYNLCGYNGTCVYGLCNYA